LLLLRQGIIGRQSQLQGLEENRLLLVKKKQQQRTDSFFNVTSLVFFSIASTVAAVSWFGRKETSRG
jgi:hypothetical protein